jgi:5'-nucleotidase (lipoprotein e(P4) family)
MKTKFSLSAAVVFAALVSTTFAQAPKPAAPPTSEHLVQSTLWVQRAGEFRALCYQAYNAARWSLEVELKKPAEPGKKRAVIVDIDETVLDNSPYEARLIKTQKGWSQPTWKEWTDMARAEATAGAVEFLKEAAGKGVEVFYISNRREEERTGTVRNLKAKGFPFADDVHVLLRSTESSKAKRRAKVSDTHTIVLLCGDNLNDLTDAFDGKDPAGRLAEMEKLKTEFGRRYIILPNPMYGDFEDSLYGGNRNLPEEEKDARRKEALKDY